MKLMRGLMFNGPIQGNGSMGLWRALACIAMIAAGLSLSGCGSSVGAPCDNDRQCPADGYCCEGGDCGPGICTFSCKSDRDCPGDAACEGGKCLEVCNNDRNCPIDMSCKKSGVCAY